MTELDTIHAELVELRKEIRAYHRATIQNKADLVWIKRLVFGAFGLMFTLIGALAKRALNL